MRRNFSMRATASLGVASLAVLAALLVLSWAVSSLRAPGIGFGGALALAVILLLGSALGSVLAARILFRDAVSGLEQAPRLRRAPHHPMSSARCR
jgi:hypothetical protein